VEGKFVGTFGTSPPSATTTSSISPPDPVARCSRAAPTSKNGSVFVDKCYFRDGRARNPYFLAPNYR
jgi:hypothetical protein